MENAELNLLKAPEFNNVNDILAILLILLGVITIIVIEHLGRKYKNV